MHTLTDHASRTRHYIKHMAKPQSKEFESSIANGKPPSKMRLNCALRSDPNSNSSRAMQSDDNWSNTAILPYQLLAPDFSSVQEENKERSYGFVHLYPRK